MAKLKEIEVALGITLENKGVYYKPNARVVIELDETDTVDSRKKVWRQAWETVEAQVEEQLKSIK